MNEKDKKELLKIINDVYEVIAKKTDSQETVMYILFAALGGIARGMVNSGKNKHELFLEMWQSFGAAVRSFDEDGSVVREIMEKLPDLDPNTTKH